MHVVAWAKQFLFQVEQLPRAVGSLSGGEQARVLIARLMLNPADLLLLDEPTNDLDIPSLEVLEESLVDFPGAIVLVTHDRYLLDRVASVIVSLDGQDGVRTFADLAQWQSVQDDPRGPKRPNAPHRPESPRQPRPSDSPTWSSANWTTWKRKSRSPKRALADLQLRNRRPRGHGRPSAAANLLRTTRSRTSRARSSLRGWKSLRKNALRNPAMRCVIRRVRTACVGGSGRAASRVESAAASRRLRRAVTVIRCAAAGPPRVRFRSTNPDVGEFRCQSRLTLIAIGWASKAAALGQFLSTAATEAV